MVRFDLDGLDLFFPYDRLYEEQYNYMLELKRALDAKGHCLLEMPTGTGKTVCLISLITSYQFAHPEVGKLIYCTRTVPEMVKCVEEVRKVIDYRVKCIGAEGGKVLAVCLSSRRNLCIHERVMEESDREAVDSACRSMTASWVRQRGATSANVELCQYYEEYEKNGTDAGIAHGIYSLDDLKELGKDRGWCPYFLARHIINHANILIYNYQYVLDPKVAGLVSKELEAESIVVFDEAHNIDNVCIEALSVELDERSLDKATRCLGKLSTEVSKMKQKDANKLNEEYQRLVRGLAESGALGGAAGAGSAASPADAMLANPVPRLPDALAQEAVPGNIRRAEHFLTFMKKVVEHLKTLLRVDSTQKQSPLAFLHYLQTKTALEVKPLRFTYSRLNSLLRTLEVTHLDEFNPLQDVADFATLVATYAEGFTVITEPQGSSIPGLRQPVLQLSCLDASLAIKPVFERFKSVIITSGTLSPLDLYPTLLSFTPVVRQSMDMSMFRKSICPLVVTKGSGQQVITTRFEKRDDPSVTRDYGELLVEIATHVPDGVVCFFTSYSYMERVVQEWEDGGILRQILERKLIFIETKDVVETTLALDNFRRACDSGRGAIFLSVARGKVAEGIDFDRHYGRAVILIGVPFQYTLSPVIRERLEYLQTKFHINPSDFLTFDAMRQAAQCVGRVIRSKLDYGLMIFADSRYNRYDKRTKLPKWILDCMGTNHLDLSTGDAMDKVRRFLKEMAQPMDGKELQKILLDETRIAELTAIHQRGLQGLQARNKGATLGVAGAAALPSLTQGGTGGGAGGRGSVDGKVGGGGGAAAGVVGGGVAVHGPGARREEQAGDDVAAIERGALIREEEEERRRVREEAEAMRQDAEDEAWLERADVEEGQDAAVDMEEEREREKEAPVSMPQQEMGQKGQEKKREVDLGGEGSAMEVEQTRDVS
ncbi:DNA repair helicase [Nannochloropsis gaditana]|uniref:DNA 5'-3' helicase n=1 Tax=Nannochloropsis gaditana TaxID=72520 RepID=W7TKG5_9STRA|nr:DNA repair helicase [Nannochloropsis gaditana]